MKTCSLLAVAALASAATGYAVTPGVTDPVGVTTLTAINQPSEAGGISFLSLNLTRPVSFEATIPAGGVSTNASGQTVITFAPGTFSTALFSTPGYVEIASGPNAGVVSDVVTATDSSITLANNVSAVASAPAGNVLFRARPHWTFVTAFGTPDPSDPAALTGGTTPASADVLTLVDALPAGAARGHYFNTTAGQWRRV